MSENEPLLAVRDLEKHYPLKRGLFNREVGRVKAVDGVSFDIHRGDTLGIVGESGCGKSTAASSLIRLEDPTSGEVVFNGGGRDNTDRNSDGTHPNDVTQFDTHELRRFRRNAQMIFQDPSSSFDPRMPVGDAVGELLEIHGIGDKQQRRAVVQDLLERVGLSAEDYYRYPHEFSGGQKQRIAIARALVLNPDLIVADEPVSALDVSVQAEVLSLIEDLQDEFDLSILLISHDMSVVRNICDRVAIMYLGEIVEIGRTDDVFRDPQHPYTEALLSSIPEPDPKRPTDGITLTGTVPSPAAPPSGCRFHTRCHRVIQPTDVDLEQDVWRRVLDFRERLESGDIDIDKIKRNAIEGDAQDMNTDEIQAQLRREFDLPSHVDDPAVDTALTDAVKHAATDAITNAAETLRSVVTTPCEETAPEFTAHGPQHQSACLRHDRNETQSKADSGK